MKTQGLLLLDILAESNGTLKTTMPRFTDVQTLKTGSEGMIFHHFFWPPHSPYLNPVENVWYVLKNAVSVSFFGSTVLDLECALSPCVSVCLSLSLSISISLPARSLSFARANSWNSLPEVFVRSLCKSQPDCQQVLKLKRHIKVSVKLSASSENKETHNSLNQAVSKF